MIRNGWKIDATFSMDTKYLSCGDKTWYGYSYGQSVGSLQATFRGRGRAELCYGNCYRQGQVVVYLNDEEISRAEAYSKMKEVSFNFSKDDILLIKEINVGIIKLNSLKLSSLLLKNDSASSTQNTLTLATTSGIHHYNCYV